MRPTLRTSSSRRTPVRNDEVAEAPSDEADTEAALPLESAGNARTVTMKAWTLDEAARIIAKLQ